MRRLKQALVKQVWEYDIQYIIWLSATHLPGRQNVEADLESRQFDDRTEWMLDSNTYQHNA